MAFPTLARVKEYLGVPTTETADDPFLNNLIAGAQAFVEGYCDRKFEQAAYTDEEHDGRDTDSIYTRQYPIVSVTSVKVDDVALAAADYVVYKDEGRIRKKAGAFAGASRDVAGVIGDVRVPGVRNVKVTYSGGYAALPADLEQAAIELVKRKYQHKQKGDESITGRTLPGGESVTYFLGEVPPEIRGVLDRYRRMTVV